MLNDVIHLVVPKIILTFASVNKIKENWVMSKKEIGLIASAKYCIKNNDDNFEKYLADIIDDNYFGEGQLIFGKQRVDIESIWTDDDRTIYVHVNSIHFEGDLLLRSMSMSNQLRVIKMLEERNS